MKKTTQHTFLKMKAMPFYDLMLLFTLALFIGENMYFGWHAEAQSKAEHIFDIIIIGLFIWNGLGAIIISALRYFGGKIEIETQTTETHLCGNQHCHCMNVHCMRGHNHIG